MAMGVAQIFWAYFVVELENNMNKVIEGVRAYENLH